MTTDAAVLGVLDGVPWTLGAVVVEIQFIADSLSALEAEYGRHPLLDERWQQLNRLSLSLTGFLPLVRRVAVTVQ